MTLYPYQRLGVTFLSNNAYALLADEMGLGKSAQAITAANQCGVQTLVVICPAIAKSVWDNELETWGYNGASLIVSYDKLVRDKKLRTEIAKMQPELLLCDEAHYLKSPKAKRTWCLFGVHCNGRGLAQYAKRVWLLTGTPAPNDPSEFYTYLKGLWPETLRGANREGFVNYYFTTRNNGFQDVITGFREERKREFQQLINSIMLQRKADDVLDLPTLIWQQVPIMPKDLKPYNDLLASEGWGTISSILEAAQNNEELLAAPELSTLRRIIGSLKAAPALDYIKLLLESTGKVIVFAQHIAVLDELENALHCVRVDGSKSQRQRADAVSMFQNTDVPVFLGQIDAASTALTLTASNHVVFAENSWVPATNAQAAKRAHRIGQTRPVFIHTLVALKTIDVIVQKTLHRKQQLLNETGL